jgi:ABC-type antimicrobial peptide transport system permease subunit
MPAVISEAAAKRDWGGQDPVGTYGRFDNAAQTRFQVIGVASDVKNDGLDNPTVPEIYLPAFYDRVETMRFVVRSARPAASLVADIRNVVRSVDSEQPIHDVATMREIIQQTITLERAASFLTAFFAGAALLMAMLGIYGVISYSVRQRAVEIGMRMALGATSGGVLSLIVGGGLKMAAYGLMAGGLAAIGAAFYLDRVFQLGELGVAPFLYSAAIVAGLAFAASFVPAWRASLMSPLVAIRKEP